MSAREWTPAQKQAITTRGGDLLISAAAGSGKTAVLTERVLTLITDPERPVDIDRLLIVTFSNAAAEEMRQRAAEAAAAPGRAAGVSGQFPLSIQQAIQR